MKIALMVYIFMCMNHLKNVKVGELMYRERYDKIFYTQSEYNIFL